MVTVRSLRSLRADLDRRRRPERADYLAFGHLQRHIAGQNRRGGLFALRGAPPAQLPDASTRSAAVTGTREESLRANWVGLGGTNTVGSQRGVLIWGMSNPPTAAAQAQRAAGGKNRPVKHVAMHEPTPRWPAY